MKILIAMICMAASLTAQAVTISGSVVNNQGTKICGLVLANGQFVFSCSPDGAYSLNVPLDSAGQITIFGFADGHFPFRKVVSSGGVYDIQLQVASSSNPTTPTTNRDKTALLVGGTWAYVYTILSTFTDHYTFTSVSNTPDSSGNYTATGVDGFGRPAAGAYFASDSMWAVLAKGSIIDQFYTFTFSGNNNVSGCYYQINPPGSTNFSRCYAMSGTRSPPKRSLGTRDESRMVLEVEQDKTAGYIEESAPEMYRQLLRQLAP